MSHFYASIKGTKGEATRCGDKSRGINGHIRGWNFGVNVKMEHNADTGEDEGIFYSNSGYKRASYANTFSSYTWDEKNHAMRKVTNVRDYRAMYQDAEYDDSYAGWGKGSYGVEHYRRPKQIAFQASKDDDDKEEELTLDNIRTGRDGGIL